LREQSKKLRLNSNLDFTKTFIRAHALNADEPSALPVCSNKNMTTLLFEITNKNLLLGFIPDSIGLLLFGVALIAFAVGLRRIFNRIETVKNLERLAEKCN